MNFYPNSYDPTGSGQYDVGTPMNLPRQPPNPVGMQWNSLPQQASTQCQLFDQNHTGFQEPCPQPFVQSDFQQWQTMATMLENHHRTQLGKLSAISEAQIAKLEGHFVAQLERLEDHFAALATRLTEHFGAQLAKMDDMQREISCQLALTQDGQAGCSEKLKALGDELRRSKDHVLGDLVKRAIEQQRLRQEDMSQRSGEKR